MFVVGLTGGIGAGKTTVAALFAKLNVPIIDADKIAFDITQPGQPALTTILQHFNDEDLSEDGKLNRKKLRHIIFSNPEERLWLENLLHPLILAEMEKQIKTLSAPYCIAAIPLLFEVQPYAIIDRTLVIDIPEAIQIERVAKRDQSEKNFIETILKTQARREHRLNLADDVIVNDGSISDLTPQVERLHQRYLAMSSGQYP